MLPGLNRRVRTAVSAFVGPIRSFARRRSPGGLRFLIAALLSVAIPAVASAQQKLLSVQIESLGQSSRTHGPIAIVWRLRSESTNILRGSLSAAVVENGEVLARLTTDELALAAGEQSYRMVLPAVDSSHGGGGVYGGVSVLLRFTGPDYQADLGSFPLRISSQWERTMSLAISDPWQTQASPEIQDFIASLRIENYYAKNRDDKSIATVPCHYRPRDLGSEPLSYCAFNVLLLFREGLADLREEQLDAIVDWVSAGGAVCLAPDTIPLSRPHLEFLNRLTGGEAGQEPLIADTSGRLNLAGAPPRLCRVGLGRAVLLCGSPAKPVEQASELRRACGFLWRMRRDKIDDFVDAGTWSPPVDPNAGKDVSQLAWDRNYFRQTRIQQKRELVPESLQSVDQFLERLIPTTMRLLPLPLVGLILAGYVLLIGPVDYFVLGALRRRKWTWVLFPAVTIGVTLTTVKLSHWYMGNTETQKRVVIADVAEGNDLARTSEYRLRVSGTERTFETEVAGGLFNVIDHRRFGAGGWYNYNLGAQQGRDDENRGSQSPAIAGRIPTHFVVRQFMPQWTPKLNRVFRIVRRQAEASAGNAALREGAEDAPSDAINARFPAIEFDWNRFADPTEFSRRNIEKPEVQAHIVEATKKIPGATAAYVVYGGTLKALFGPPGGVFESRTNTTQPRYYYPGMGTPTPPNDFLRNICVHDSDAMFSVLSHIAPHGGNDFEDLPLLDAGDSQQWMLVVCIERGEELVLWRKVYPGD